MLVAKDGDTGGRAYTLDIKQSTGQLRFYINGGGGSFIVNSTAGLTNDTWGFVVGTYDHAADGGTLKIYKDGVLSQTATGAGGSIPTATAHVLIARRSYTGAETPLDGSMDDVRIYNTTLDATAISDLFDAGPE